MSNCFLLWKNRLKDASLTGGGWQLGLDNLKSENLSLVCRSGDLAVTNTQFSLTYPQTIYNRAIALINHNLSTTAQIRITATRDSGAFTVYDSRLSFKLCHVILFRISISPRSIYRAEK